MVVDGGHAKIRGFIGNLSLHFDMGCSKNTLITQMFFWRFCIEISTFGKPWLDNVAINDSTMSLTPSSLLGDVKYLILTIFNEIIFNRHRIDEDTQK